MYADSERSSASARVLSSALSHGMIWIQVFLRGPVGVIRVLRGIIVMAGECPALSFPRFTQLHRRIRDVDFTFHEVDRKLPKIVARALVLPEIVAVAPR